MPLKFSYYEYLVEPPPFERVFLVEAILNTVGQGPQSFCRLIWELVFGSIDRYWHWLFYKGRCLTEPTTKHQSEGKLFWGRFLDQRRVLCNRVLKPNETRGVEGVFFFLYFSCFCSCSCCCCSCCCCCCCCKCHRNV